MFTDEMIDPIRKQYLTEAYFSKPDTLVECEELLKKIKENDGNGKNPNKVSKNLISKMEKNLAKEFGFEKTKITILNEPYMNAFTVPFFQEKNFNDKSLELTKKNGEGLAFSKPEGKFLYLYITSELLFLYDVKTIMAVVIHEIGHNFFLVDEQKVDMKIKNGIYSLIYILYNWYPLDGNGKLNTGIIDSLLDISVYLNSPQKYIDKTVSNKKTDNVFKYEKQVRDKSTSRLFKTFRTLADIMKAPLTSVSSIIKILLSPMILSFARQRLSYDAKYYKSYNAEKFSDNFAISYGYGVETAELWGTFKMNKKKKYSYNVPILRVINYFDESLLYGLLYFGDEHPDNIKRFKMVRDKLNYELNNNKELLPEHRAEIEEQLKYINELEKKAPYFKKVVDKLFKNLNDSKDEIGSKGIDEEDIFAFDDKILGEFVKKVK